MVYLNASYSTISISNNVKTINKSSYVIGQTNLLEHRVVTESGNKISKVNSKNLSFNYKVNDLGYLVKTEWTNLYNFLQSDNPQIDFINACKSSWVNNILIAIK